MVHLQPLRLEQFGQSALGVVARHKAETLGQALTRDALTDDQLEPARRAVIAIAGVDVAAVYADGQRAIRPRQRMLVTLAALDEEGLLVTQLALQPLGHLLCVPIDRGSVGLQRQHLLQDADGDPKREQGSPLRLQIASFRRRPLLQAHSQGTAAPR